MNINDLPPRYQKQAEEKGAVTPKKAVKTNKYRNKRVTVDGIKFDSQKEAQRFEELKMLQNAGDIRELKLQHEFTLQGAFTTTDGERVRSIKYIADFTYYRGNLFIIEDVKSKATKDNSVYKLKKKMMAEKGWRITET